VSAWHSSRAMLSKVSIRVSGAVAIVRARVRRARPSSCRLGRRWRALSLGVIRMSSRRADWAIRGADLRSGSCVDGTISSGIPRAVLNGTPMLGCSAGLLSRILDR